MPFHPARRQHLLHVVDHRRIAAQHHMRIGGGEYESCARLEPPILDQRGNAPRQRAGMRLAAHHRHIGKCAGMRAEDTVDDVAIGKVRRNAMINGMVNTTSPRNAV